MVTVRSSMVYRTGMVDRSSMVYRTGIVDRCGMVARCVVWAHGVVGGRSMIRSWCVVSRRSVIRSRSLMSGRCMMSGGRVVGGRGVVGRRVSNSIVLHISHVSVVVVSMVLDMLGPAIRKEDRVGSLYITRTISNLSSIEVGSGILVMHSVLVAVGFRLLLVGWCVIGAGGRVRCWYHRMCMGCMG